MAAVVRAWEDWEGQLINGLYPLRRFLNASDHSSVFLTESGTEGFFNAAIKLVPTDAANSEAQLWHWRTAATISHPHLIRLLDSGACELDGAPYLFVVMEYAEETLSQILPYRALESDEARELLVPTLQALAFLHRENWVQGQLKPSNFLVVNDQLKLAIDTIRPIGMPRTGLTPPTLYDPPEAEVGEVSTAGDVWGLGTTLVEALTQQPPYWPGGKTGAPEFRAAIPAAFAGVIQRCLAADPAERPSIEELQAQTAPAPSATGVPGRSSVAAPPADMHAVRNVSGEDQTVVAASARTATAVEASAPAPVRAAASQAARATPIRAETRDFRIDDQPSRTSSRHAIAAVVLVAAAAGGAWWMLHRQTDSAGAPVESSQSSAASESTDSSAAAGTGSQAPSDTAAAPLSGPSADPTPRAAAVPPAPPPVSSQGGAADVAPAPQASPRPRISAPVARASAAPVATAAAGSTAGDASAAVTHQDIPAISAGSRSTIHGHVRVAVRITVDKGGNVINDIPDTPSSSRYFNRVASDSSRKWTFTASTDQEPRVFVLHYEFGRDGTAVRVTAR